MMWLEVEALTLGRRQIQTGPWTQNAEKFIDYFVGVLDVFQNLRAKNGVVRRVRNWNLVQISEKRDTEDGVRVTRVIAVTLEVREIG